MSSPKTSSNCLFCNRPVIKEHGYVYLSFRVTQVFPESKDGKGTANDLMIHSLDFHRKCAMSEIWRVMWQRLRTE
jgi:hypothetical protein